MIGTGVVPKIRLTPPPTPYGVWRMWEYNGPLFYPHAEIAVWRYGYEKPIRLPMMDIRPETNVVGLWWLDERVQKK